MSDGKESFILDCLTYNWVWKALKEKETKVKRNCNCMLKKKKYFNVQSLHGNICGRLKDISYRSIIVENCRETYYKKWLFKYFVNQIVTLSRIFFEEVEEYLIAFFKVK